VSDLIVALGLVLVIEGLLYGGLPRFAKRLVQAGLGAALTAAIFLVVMVGNGLLVGQRRSLEAGFKLWLAFVQRPVFPIPGSLRCGLRVAPRQPLSRREERLPSGSPRVPAPRGRR
jgi:uncharacterized protein